jgi:hypothetical protein
MAVLVGDYRLSHSLFHTNYNSVLQSLHHTVYRAVYRRPSFLEASLELTDFSLKLIT